jgi:hypothetical protein
VQALMGTLALVAGAAAVSEAAVALGIAGLGASSRSGWSLRDIVLSAAVLALLFAGPLVAGLAFTPLAGAAARAVSPAALATAAVVVARYVAYDPYYAPYRRRIAEGILPTWWIVLVAGLAIFAVARSRTDPRTSLLVAGIAMFLAGPTLVVAVAGH